MGREEGGGDPGERSGDGGKKAAGGRALTPNPRTQCCGIEHACRENTRVPVLGRWHLCVMTLSSITRPKRGKWKEKS